MFASTKTRLILRDLLAEKAAIHLSQAVIEFAPDGTILTANDNFLQTVGYRLDEIAGRHHSIFVPRKEREGAPYEEFWAALRRGEFRTAEFTRITKDGREIRLQAS